MELRESRVVVGNVVPLRHGPGPRAGQREISRKRRAGFGILPGQGKLRGESREDDGRLRGVVCRAAQPHQGFVVAAYLEVRPAFEEQEYRCGGIARAQTRSAIDIGQYLLGSSEE